MFSRLLKYEWKANAGLLGLLSLAALGIGVLATIVLRILLNAPAAWDDVVPENLAAMIGIAMFMFLFFAAVALSLYAISVQFILLYRFYKNKYTDEGYLTFTLPVKTGQIFWSSFLNMLIWLLISMLVVVAVVCLVGFVGTAREGLFNMEFVDTLEDVLLVINGQYWQAISQRFAIAYLVCRALKLLITPFYALFLPMACITAGAVLAKKHKIFASFGVYYLVNLVVGIITSVATLGPNLIMMNDMETGFVISNAIQLGITLVVTVGAYFFTIHVMKKKLNLP